MPAELKKLMDGYGRFRENFKKGSHRLYESLSKEGQHPRAIVIACSDSRVDPAIILDCDPGDLFVIRNVANLVPPYENDNHYHGTSAALEFGIRYLNITNIIVLGHSQCGGIRSLLESYKYESDSFITKWMELAKASTHIDNLSISPASINHQAHRCEQESLAGSLNNLMTFPWIAERVAENKLALHAWYFNLTNGTIDQFNKSEQRFLPLIQE